MAALACRRTPATPPARDVPAPTRDARVVPPVDAVDVEPEPFGPPNPWGDGSLPRSTAAGPEADQTRAAMTALRATIGFWRVDRRMRDRCPTLDNLAGTPGAMFDPATMRNDPWGQPFEIECQGAQVRLRSLGPDRLRDTGDDLWSR